MPLREIEGPCGRLECLLEEPETAARAAVVLAHPLTTLGGTMHTKAVFHAAKALVRIGCAVFRFNFRGAGASAGEFAHGEGEMDDLRASIGALTSTYPTLPLWVGGMSFGAWVSMRVGIEEPRVSTLIGIATPVCRYDFDLIARSEKAKFLIHGERDEVCSLKEVRAFYARAAEPKELVVIDAADHLFDGKVSDVADAIEELLGDWTT